MNSIPKQTVGQITEAAGGEKAKTYLAPSKSGQLAP